jgi:hypothetical protein
LEAQRAQKEMKNPLRYFVIHRILTDLDAIKG